MGDISQGYCSNNRGISPMCRSAPHELSFSRNDISFELSDISFELSDISFFLNYISFELSDISFEKLEDCI